MKLVFTLFCIVLSLYGCSSVKVHNLCGTYILKEFSKPHDIIEIKQDGTFFYTSDFHLFYGKTAGYWTLNNRKLTLTTYEDYISNYFGAIESKSGSFPKDKITFLFVLENDKPGIGWISIQDNLIYSSNDGKVKISKELLLNNDLIIKIHAGQFLVEGFRYSINNIENNLIIINDVIEDRYRFEIENEVFKIRNNYLVDDRGYRFIKQ
jgi:hypothetical protein